MFGPSPAPPSPPSSSAGSRIALRVVFAVAAFLTCGLLSCLPLFRIAMMRGRWYDWTAAWLSLPVSISAFAVVGSLPESNHGTDVALACVLLLGAGSAVHFVIFDIRDLERQRSAAPSYFASRPGYSAPTQPQVNYGYPPQAPTPVPGAQAHPQRQRPQAPQPPFPHQAPYAQPQPQPQPQQPQPQPQPSLPADRPAHRIDQVRAELDELSDLLRKDTDGRRGESR
ncbi:hypothetical protein AB0436_21720 [Streptomyces sp. NPDC051322]|uniref:hypothetical protein n=1 Tax=Streptomyces sp. NPDC051322 TaxID=3154645 RepID=UPI00344D3814